MVKKLDPNGEINRRENMKNIFKRIHRDSKGFTLVELLIVFALLAVLAAVV